jgi:hypothetical protein
MVREASTRQRSRSAAILAYVAETIRDAPLVRSDWRRRTPSTVDDWSCDSPTRLSKRLVSVVFVCLGSAVILETFQSDGPLFEESTGMYRDLETETLRNRRACSKGLCDPSSSSSAKVRSPSGHKPRKAKRQQPPLSLPTCQPCCSVLSGKQTR